jgi:hypothetical protein
LENNHLENQGEDGRITLRRIFEEYFVHESGSRSCTIVNYGTSSVEILASTTRELVRLS